jgi:hypothetical protein
MFFNSKRSDLPTINLNTNNSNSKIKIKLEDMDLWKQFNSIGTEMVLSKRGRCMFPSLRISISGLEMGSKYSMAIEMMPYDENRYKYIHGEWIVSEKNESPYQPKFVGYRHPSSPSTGSYWMKEIISFNKLRFTNNSSDTEAGHVFLNSMHKYVPRLHIMGESKIVSTFTFTDATFMAVTSYQNESITKLKIEHNPFAKKKQRSKRGLDEDENDYKDENDVYSPIYRF